MLVPGIDRLGPDAVLLGDIRNWPLVGSRRIVTICSSVNRVFFMAPSLAEGAILSGFNWSENRRVGSSPCDHARNYARVPGAGIKPPACLRMDFSIVTGQGRETTTRKPWSPPPLRGVLKERAVARRASAPAKLLDDPPRLTRSVPVNGP